MDLYSIWPWQLTDRAILAIRQTQKKKELFSKPFLATTPPSQALLAKGRLCCSGIADGLQAWGWQLAAVRLPPGPGCEFGRGTQTKPQMQRPGHTGRKALATKKQPGSTCQTGQFYIFPLKLGPVQSDVADAVAKRYRPWPKGLRADSLPWFDSPLVQGASRLRYTDKAQMQRPGHTGRKALATKKGPVQSDVSKI